MCVFVVCIKNSHVTDTQHILPLNDAAVLLQLNPMCRHGTVLYIKWSCNYLSCCHTPSEPPHPQVTLSTVICKCLRLSGVSLQQTSASPWAITARRIRICCRSRNIQQNFSKLTSSNFKTPKDYGCNDTENSGFGLVLHFSVKVQYVFQYKKYTFTCPS